MCMHMLLQPTVLLRIHCSILILLLKTVHCSVVCCSIPHCISEVWYNFFWHGDNESNNTYKLQKRVFLIISRHKSFRRIFKDNNILTLASLYILEIVCYIKKYKHSLKSNVKYAKKNWISLFSFAMWNSLGKVW